MLVARPLVDQEQAQGQQREGARQHLGTPRDPDHGFHVNGMTCEQEAGDQGAGRGQPQQQAEPIGERGVERVKHQVDEAEGGWVRAEGLVVEQVARHGERPVVAADALACVAEIPVVRLEQARQVAEAADQPVVLDQIDVVPDEFVADRVTVGEGRKRDQQCEVSGELPGLALAILRGFGSHSIIPGGTQEYRKQLVIFDRCFPVTVHRRNAVSIPRQPRRSKDGGG
jgi:hypothetical protein